MPVVQIPPNEAVIHRFSQLIKNKRLAHAYLFVGAPGSGKSETAYSVARTLSSEMDIHTVETLEDQQSIKIDQVRELLNQIKLRPFNSEKKVFILKNIEHMTVEGGNALLKTLEEPSANSFLFLTTAAPDKLLETLKSRCHRIYFSLPPKEELAEILKNQYNEGSKKAHFLGYFTGGSLGLAIHLSKEGFFDIKNRWIDQFILGPEADQFIKNEFKSKETTRAFLEVLLSWIADALLVKSGVDDERLTHLDRIDDLRHFHHRFSMDQLYAMYEQIVPMFGMLADNFNMKMPLLILKESLWEKSFKSS